MGIIEFRWILPDLTVFYRVLPGFTGFYRVLPGFMELETVWVGKYRRRRHKRPNCGRSTAAAAAAADDDDGGGAGGGGAASAASRRPASPDRCVACRGRCCPCCATPTSGPNRCCCP